jgi:hypothetical protein
MMKIAFAVIALLAAGPTQASVLFTDNFNAGANPAWGDESGKWRAVGGTYDASIPGNGSAHPVTYSSVTTFPSLKNFTVKVTVKDLNDGGVWLRSSYGDGKISGVLLVTGGQSGTYNGFYWHIVNAGSFSGILNAVSVAGVQGSTQSLRIVVKGSTYSLYLGKSTTPITTLTTTDFTSGAVGLYDYSPNSGVSRPRGQVFDNVQISSP